MFKTFFSSIFKNFYFFDTFVSIIKKKFIKLNINSRGRIEFRKIFAVYFVIPINNVSSSQIKIKVPMDGIVRKILPNNLSFIIENKSGVQLLVLPKVKSEYLTDLSLLVREGDRLTISDFIIYKVKNNRDMFKTIHFYIPNFQRNIKRITSDKIFLK